MADTDDYAAAFKELVRLVQPDTDPVLTKGGGVTPDATKELDSVLVAAKVASTFAASTAYAYGAVVLPSTRNGRRYRVTQGGTSGATEPTWPTDAYGTVTSGSGSPALTFEEDGPAPSNIYDVRRAAYEAWNLKAAKASDRVSLTSDGQSVSEHQTPQFCLSKAQRYAPLGVA